ncbi:MAG TPA: hypothetical protein VL200_04090 [Lacunisphaera sp.]|jgi:hypothetical protein|nr:hypothetical protein [Lacunisphaera sp.]
MSLRTGVVLGAALVLAGCHPMAPEGSLVATQTPVSGAAAAGPTVLDVRYPAGSRVVLMSPPFQPDAVQVLSGGLVAAGDPRVSWDGRWVYFAGKSSVEADWQIYRVNAGGGRPQRVTAMPGGAMDPALAAHEELVFSSPVPAAGRLWSTNTPASLYGQLPDREAERLTYSPDSAAGSTVLRDGRVLFVTTKPRDDRMAPPHLSLYTINNNGTEVTAYAGQDDGMTMVRRPRELGDGRVAFLTARGEDPAALDRAECVRSSDPFGSRGDLLAFRDKRCRSVEPLPGGDLLACLETRDATAMMDRAAVYRVAAEANAIGAPLFDDPRWSTIEATAVVARPAPAGHTSAVKPGATHGTLFCLDVNRSRRPAAGDNPARAAALRVFALMDSGQVRPVGQVPVDADGSVIVQLPAGVPLGLDTLDAAGNVLRHQPAFIWLRPGENRACIGCHEPRNHGPRNVRPLAATHGPAHLDFADVPTHAATAKP